MPDDLERRAIIAAHDAQCGDRHCEYVHMPSLSKREAAIVEAWRGDRATSHDSALRDVAAAYKAAIGRVRQLHSSEPGQHPCFCGHDLHELPCATLRALDGTEADRG